MKPYDIAFVGHMCFDAITPFGGEEKVAPGSAVLCGAMVAARIEKTVAAIVKMAPGDEAILAPMKSVGIDTFLIPAAETTFSKVFHPVADVDVRELTILKSAGIITVAELPDIPVNHMHLAGISNTEFDMELLSHLATRNHTLSVDMQSFVRQVDPATRIITFADVPGKKAIVEMMDLVKMDIVEAGLLTGTDDLHEAAAIVAGWGCPEVVITHSNGVLARHNGKTYYEPFSNRSTIGRTGRGDTTFAAYLAHRMNHNSEQSLIFAAALCSIKMENVGPFAGTIQDVEQRIRERHR
jgi:sugar/nucleoside kinase (ribokinase family)